MLRNIQDTVALYVLRDILREGMTTEALASRYSLTDFAIKRHLCELRHLGVELALVKQDAREVWHCDNAELIRSSALFGMWSSEDEVSRVA